MSRFASLDILTSPKEVIAWYKNAEDAPMEATLLEVDDSLYLDALSWNSQGYVVHVTMDETSLDYSAVTYSNSEKWLQHKTKAKRMLDDTAEEVIDCYANSVAVNPDLVTYRSDLQAIISADEMGDPDAVVFPVYP